MEGFGESRGGVFSALLKQERPLKEGGGGGGGEGHKRYFKRKK